MEYVVVTLIITILAIVGVLYLLFLKDFKRQKVSTYREQIKQEEQILDFPLGDVLSLYTGNILSPRGIAGIHRLLNYLYGTELYDYQLKDKAEEALPWINLQHPEFANLKFEDTEQPAYWAEWLDDQITKFGASITLAPIPIDELKPQTHKEAWEKAKAEEKRERVEKL